MSKTESGNEIGPTKEEKNDLAAFITGNKMRSFSFQWRFAYLMDFEKKNVHAENRAIEFILCG